MKTQSSGKEAEAGQNLKRPKTTKGENSVNGHAAFENGKLAKKEFAKKILDDEKGLLEVANQIAKPKKQKAKVEKIPDETDPKWEEYITLNNCKSQAKREEIKQMIETALALPDISWSRIGGDFVAKTNNRIILRICAMTRPPTFSAMCPALGPSISRYTFEEVMQAIPKAHAMFYKQKALTKKGTEQHKSINGEEAVAILKAKVEGLSKSSKGFVVPKEVRVTDPEVKSWIKENCYSAVADKIMLNRVP
jgi:hypothetical protein